MKFWFGLAAMIYFAFGVYWFDPRYSILALFFLFLSWCWKDSVRKLRVRLVTMSISSAAITYYWFFGRSVWITLVFFGLSGFIAYQVLALGPRWKIGPLPARLALLSLVSSLFFWVCVSSYDYFLPSGKALQLDPSRLARRSDNWPNSKVAIALSGGGYRAVFLHAGVLAAYERLGLKASAVAGVSGGAIVGSYYVAGGNPQQLFLGLTQHDFDLPRRILQFPNAVHLASKLQIPLIGLKLNPFSHFDRTMVQSKLIDDVFLHGTTWNSLRQNHAPQFLIGTTDIVHGSAFGFTADGILVRPVNDPSQSHDFINGIPMDESATTVLRESGTCKSPEKLSDLVAASGAVPGAFSSFNPECQALSEVPQESLLVDGGVTDNSGLGLLIAAGNKIPQWQYDLIVVSDAGSLLPDISNQMFTPNPIEDSSAEQVLRSMDVVFSNSQTKRFGTSSYNPQTLLLSPAPFMVDDPDRVVLGRTGPTRADFYLMALRAIERAGMKYNGKLLAIPLNDISQEEFEATNYHTLGNAGPFRDRASLIEEAKACCQMLPWSGLPAIKGNIAPFMAHDFADCVATFIQAATLSTSLTTGEANRIFRLGEYLAILSWESTAKALDAVELSRKTQGKLEVFVELPKEPGKIGETSVIEFVIANRTVDDSPHVVFNMDVPANFSVISAFTRGTSEEHCAILDQKVSCIFGDIHRGDRQTVAVVVRTDRYVRQSENGYTGIAGMGENWVNIRASVNSSSPSRFSSTASGEQVFLLHD